MEFSATELLIKSCLCLLACSVVQANNKEIDALFWLTHWDRVTYISVSKLTSIGSDSDLSPGRRQAILLNQWWNIHNSNLTKKKLRWKLKWNSYIFIQENDFWKCRLGNGVYLFRSHCVKWWVVVKAVWCNTVRRKLDSFPVCFRKQIFWIITWFYAVVYLLFEFAFQY